MIPVVRSQFATTTIQEAFVVAVEQSGFGGQVDSTSSTRVVYSTDNSIYQLEPGLVLFPKSVDDIALIARTAARSEFRNIVLAVRGGGTGTNAQSLTNGVVIDMSRHMNRIRSIDPVRRTAVVEAGVVKDQLNEALKPHGLFFAPELSTSNRATIGGMVNTDACGQGSCVYGKTSNHVLKLRVVLLDGTEWLVQPLTGDALRRTLERKDRVGEVCRLADEIEREYRSTIESTFPKLNRFMTGYDLAHLRVRDGALNINALLCGSEGTLAITAEAELNLLPIPTHSALINIRYATFDSALRHAWELANMKVASVETLDAKVLSLARNDIIWTGVAPYFPRDRSGDAEGINIVEVVADDASGLRAKVDHLTTVLFRSGSSLRLGFTVVTDAADIAAIWAMRKRAVGLLGNTEGARRPVAFVEDTAVPPEHLADYIGEFRALLDAEGLDYGMFGHIDAGVLHVRPALDLTDPQQQAVVRRVSDAVVNLTQKYGGVLWGEHGKGVRSEYVPNFFGSLYPQLQRLKAAFDPYNQLNPGKIATPAGGALTKIDELPLRGSLDSKIPAITRSAFDNATNCNGNGACFDFEADSAMCPSFKATGDRRYSPKGRASLIREWLRLLAEQKVDPIAEARRWRGTSGWRRFGTRLLNSASKKDRTDFSHQVREAMDTCLACKACVGQCPVKVDVPAFRSKFLELYYGRYLRPLKDPIVASIEHTLPWAAKMPFLYNQFTRSGFGKTLMRQIGLTALPKLPSLSLRTELSKRHVGFARPATLDALSVDEKAKTVVFVQDAFTSFFEPRILLDMIDLVLGLGFRPFVAELQPNGKVLHVHGYLGAFAKTAARNARHLSKLAASEVDLVGLEPSMTLCYRSEYAGALSEGSVPTVLLPQEWLAMQLDVISGSVIDAPTSHYRLLPHCTERTNAADATTTWVPVFRAFGIDLKIAQAGCCGMAGTFGHEVKNRSLSEAIYDLGWRRLIEKCGPNDVLMATGYSCRSQAKLVESKVVLHPVQVLKTLVAGRKSSLHTKVA